MAWEKHDFSGLYREYETVFWNWQSYPTLSYSISARRENINFDHLFKKYAPDINWDWRLLASLAYTESNFDTTAVSWAGAKGLMQLMPATARAMGVPPGKEQNPEESIKAATKYIAATAKSFSKIPQEERINFILASYNSGIGHVFDAMALVKNMAKTNMCGGITWKTSSSWKAMKSTLPIRFARTGISVG